jgi:hypothetical protein
MQLKKHSSISAWHEVTSLLLMPIMATMKPIKTMLALLIRDDPE